MRFEQQWHHRPQQELHLFAPTLHRMENIEPWLKRIRMFLSSSDNEVTSSLSSEERAKKQALIFYLGPPGVGKFTSATTHIAEFKFDPSDKFSLSDPISIPANIKIGYDDYAWELFSARQNYEISSPHGTMGSRRDQDHVSQNMIMHIQEWLEKNENQTAALFIEAVGVSYPELNQGATSLVWATQYAHEHPNIKVFTAFLRGEQIQKTTKIRRQKLENVEDPSLANEIYQTERRLLDQPLRSPHEVQIARYSYAQRPGIEKTTKTINDLAFEYVKKHSGITRKEFDKDVELRDTVIQEYYQFLEREIFGLYAADTYHGTNTELRRKNAAIPVNIHLAIQHLIINLPLDKLLDGTL